MSVKKSVSGPYRATKLWNDAVRTFYNGMPVSRHWRGLRQYERCFTASEAIDWFHVHLKSNPNFGSGVSREQTTKLLRKFVKAGLIEDVRGSSSLSEDFKDNRELYRFSNKSPLKALRTPRTPGRVALGTINLNNLSSSDGSSPALKKRWDISPKLLRRARGSGSLRRSDSKVNVVKRVSNVFGENASNEAKDSGGMQECHVVAKTITKEEEDDVWKRVFLDRLDVVCNHVLFGNSSTLLNPDIVNGNHLHHNTTQITARGVVQAPEGHPDDLPNWILTAMKCMAHWPNAADSSCNIPNYPGVEKDVFKIVQDFFTNMAVPLIPHEMYDPIIRLYIGAEFLDISCRSTSSSHENSEKGEGGSYIFSSNNLGGGDSVENLILNMSISSQQKTSTPCLDEENVGNENAFGGRRRSSLKRELPRGSNRSELHTPTHHFREIQNMTNPPQSLRLRRLKNYTDFKEDNLYPSLLEGSCDTTVQKDSCLDKPRVLNPSTKIYESLVSKQAETVRSVKSNDFARRMKRESKEGIGGFESNIRSSEIGGISLPDNCCFETAFTSDSPKTRIIPQKSIDTVHLSGGENSKPRPKSIAVTSFAGLDTCKSEGNLWDTTIKDNKSFALESGFLPSIETVGSKSTMALSPLSRSRSAGNLQALSDSDNKARRSISPELDDAPYKSLASRLLDSVKRKNSQNYLVTPKTASQVKRAQTGRRVENSVRHLRTKSGGYMNPALAVAPSNVDECMSMKSDICDKEHPSGVAHLRTKSGGFLNLALVPSNNSLDATDSFDSVSTAPTIQSEPPVRDCHRYTPSRCSNPEGSAYRTAIGSESLTHSSIMPSDGCLSHVLSSGSLCSSSRSIYYSVHSHCSRNSTPTLPCHSIAEKCPSVRDTESQCSSSRSVGNDILLEAPAEADISKHFSMSANNLSDGWVDRTPYGKVPPFAQGGVWRHYHSSPSKRLIGKKKGIDKYVGSKACLPGLLTREGKEAAIGSTQLLLMMLSPISRRKLHLLLRMMNKMSNNEKLNISDKQTTRALVLTTFARSILLCSQEADYDELLSLRIVSFMMDNHEEIMRPPEDMAVLVHRRLTQLQRSQIVYDSTVWDRSMTLAYCQQVSQTQYERQRMTGSQQFLAQLLDQIITNDKLSNKEKRKKLKEFKSLYPETYKERFPADTQEKEKSSSRLRNLMKFTSLTSLGKNRTLRL